VYLVPQKKCVLCVLGTTEEMCSLCTWYHRRNVFLVYLVPQKKCVLCVIVIELVVFEDVNVYLKSVRYHRRNVSSYNRMCSPATKYILSWYKICSLISECCVRKSSTSTSSPSKLTQNAFCSKRTHSIVREHILSTSTSSPSKLTKP